MLKARFFTKTSAFIGAKLVISSVLNLDNPAYRMVLYRRSYRQVSALSTIVGAVLEYHGINE